MFYCFVFDCLLDFLRVSEGGDEATRGNVLVQASFQTFLGRRDCKRSHENKQMIFIQQDLPFNNPLN